MILMDFSQIVMSGVHANFGRMRASEFNEDFFRHMVTNQIRANRKRFAEYGELVICCDGRDYWRREIFPHYKAGRKKHREASKIPFDEIFKWLDQYKQDIRDYFPYKIVEVEHAEADDVIGVLTKRYAPHEKIMIISNDGDFQQLHVYQNVQQYSSIQKKYIVCDDPKNYLLEHVIKAGDDGIPNVLSDPDTFVTDGKRQKSVRKIKLEEWTQMPLDKMCEDMGITPERYMLNRQLIDLNMIPKNIVQKIVDEYENATVAHGSKLLTYFIKNKMAIMTDHISDFF